MARRPRLIRDGLGLPARNQRTRKRVILLANVWDAKSNLILGSDPACSSVASEQCPLQRVGRNSVSV
jgi:hypothetical protein